ncbi:outer membrane beta-barrel protein [Niabella soli]|uniref:Outer membrane protein beta-barrel domain-containing protein n=1 Tax=Niabella soli DSM 19437 TaxID=929713 RepID=W0F805_9BACT|nr:outer membrane beta-barrel protein [Niabella soli]AHF17496.1 hypothetical protein NIASO_08820 [Niabella soli DSM 19437]
MRKIFYLTLLLLWNTLSQAQISIHGQVQDDAGAPVPAATITWLRSRADSKSVTTDSSGKFLIPSLQVGTKYHLEVSAVNHEEAKLTLELKNDTTIRIVLPRNNTMLNNVTVSGRAKLIQMKPNKTIVNIADNLTIVGSNIAEALQKIPGIRISNDEVSIPGKGAVQIMQDGRLLQLSQKELLSYLKSIPAGTVSKIEIITNPSAAYDASGNAGLINIITKRTTQQGYSGSIQAGYKQYQHYPGMDATGNINYNSGKWQLYANANIFRIRHKYGFRWEEYYPDRTWIMSDTGDYKQQNLAINAGADYQLSSKSTIGFNVGFSRYFEGGADYVRNSNYNGSGQTDSVLTTYADYFPVARTQSYNLYYKTKLDTSGKTFSLDGSYLTFYRTDTSNVTARSFLPDGQPIPSSTARYTNATTQNINIYAVKADMELPLSFARLQFGGKINFIDMYDDLRYYRVSNPGYTYDRDLSNEYKYTENSQALYVNVNRELGNWSWEAGLRGELTQTNGYSFLSGQRNNNNYLKLFPNALISYKMNGANLFSLTYNKRVRRPTFWNLNPYKSILTAYSYYEGNPFLQPEYNSNFQLLHIYKNKLTSALFATITNNGFDDITIAHADTNFVLRTPKNFVNSLRIGLSEAYTFSTFRWWESTTLLNIYYTDGRSKLSYVADRKGWGAYVSNSNTLYFNTAKTLAAAINFWYQFPEVSLVNRSDPYWNLDLGFNAVLVKDKLTLNANVQDVFGTSAASYTNVVNNVQQRYATLQLNRNYSLTLIFKFGKKDLKAIEHTNSDQEERKRI